MGDQSGTASVFISLEFAAYLATTEVCQGLYLDTADEHELYRAFQEATFKHLGSVPIGEPGAGLVLSFKKDDDGYEGLALLAYMAENGQEMCNDSEHGDSYRQACKEMAPGLDTAQEMLAKFLNDQES